MPCSYSYIPICSWTRLLIKLIVYLMNTERINNYFDYRVAMETKWLTVRAMGFIVYLKLYLLGTHVIHDTQETVRPWQVSWLFLNPIKRVACGWTGQPPKLFWCRIEDYRICRTKKGMVICAAAGEWWPRGGDTPGSLGGNENSESGWDCRAEQSLLRRTSNTHHNGKC